MLRLNLLPPERKRAWAAAQKLAQWRGAMIVVVLGCVFSNLSLYVLDHQQGALVQGSADKLRDWQTLTAKQEAGQITKATKEVNAAIMSLQNLFVPISPQTKKVASFMAELPAGIRVTKLNIATDGSLILSGIAATRASFISLKSTLDASTLVTNMTTSSVANLRENVPFEYTGQIVTTL